MATEATIDIAALLEPIATDKPTGVDMREDNTALVLYRQLKYARKEASRQEKEQLEHEDTSSLAPATIHWKPVLTLSPQLLKTYSKDLDVAAWYIEALLRTYGFSGLRDGFILTGQLVELYWDDLYPLPDDDGIETRVATLSGLNGSGAEGTLPAPMRMVPLTDASSDLPFSAWHYEQALALHKIADQDKKQARIEAGDISLESIERAVRATPPTFYINLQADLQACKVAFKELSARLDAKCGHDAPPASYINATLDRVISIVGFLTKDLILETSPEVADETSMEMTDGMVSTTLSGKSIESAVISNRDEAFRTLLRVSDFFRRTEPHSPISYNLEQAVKWGKMPLPELLGELIQDRGAREEYFRLVGISQENE